MDTEKGEIDDSLYSRQRYVLGDSAMKRMANSSVFISGLGGLGIEIAKNVTLAGIKSLTVHDSNRTLMQDLGTQFFLRETDVKSKKNRAEASVDRLAELNPYVSVKSMTAKLTNETDLLFLKDFQCVVLTETPLSLLLKVNKFCRNQSPQIKFIAGDVYGLFSGVFCDFGDEFTVFDPTGEDPKECFISNITKANPGVVTTLDNTRHGFSSEEVVKFKEVQGMDILNGKEMKIDVVSPYAFKICDTSGDEFQPFVNGGITVQVKQSQIAKFQTLKDQLIKPSVSDVDFGKNKLMSHIAFHALHMFREKNNRLPGIRSPEDADELFTIATDLKKHLILPEYEEDFEVDKKVLTAVAYTSQGCFAPLCASIGGVLAQEVLKALTGKFRPLNQWMYIDAIELLKDVEGATMESFQPRGDRYDSLRVCIGDELCQKLAKMKLFMVGCGAIGCEMLKNYAMLGIGSAGDGKIVMTDHDLIEKSNLNRQFLFRPKHIQKPKSVTAAQSTKEINPALRIKAHQNKVHPDTEKTFYNDAFFESQDMVVNALDNVEARKYMDSRCISNCKPMMESGTLGAKGHVQVIIPQMTETYGSQQDPPEGSVPYCTLKSFPASVEHTIQWARDKFESLFTQKPLMINKYWAQNGSVDNILKLLEKLQPPEKTILATKFMKNRPKNWEGCVVLARLKFEKYFNHKAMQLITAFPKDSKTTDGTPFWQSPKRPPTPIVFDAKNKLHMDFIESCSRLVAYFSNIPKTNEDLERGKLETIIAGVNVPEYVHSSKLIITDDVQLQEVDPDQEGSLGDQDIEMAKRTLQSLQKEGRAEGEFLRMSPIQFEKDDDSNGHIDFITAASNLRATMYSIDNADRFKTKRIAGRIIPAIATTTAAVSGLVTIEMVKYMQGAHIEDYKNCFLNLSCPMLCFSEPGPTRETIVKEGLKFNEWDRWEVRGSSDFTLTDFMKYFKDKHRMDISLVVQGTKMIYVALMPGHKKRLPQKMMNLLKVSDGTKYVDLTIGFEPEGDEDEDLPAPPVRYFLGV